MSPVETAKEATNFQHKLWENHELTAQPVITYIYGKHPVYIIFQNVFL